MRMGLSGLSNCFSVAEMLGGWCCTLKGSLKSVLIVVLNRSSATAIHDHLKLTSSEIHDRMRHDCPISGPNWRSPEVRIGPLHGSDASLVSAVEGTWAWALGIVLVLDIKGCMSVGLAVHIFRLHALDITSIARDVIRFVRDSFCVLQNNNFAHVT